MRLSHVCFLLTAFKERLRSLKAFSSTLSGRSLTVLIVSLASSADTKLTKRRSDITKSVRWVEVMKLSIAANLTSIFLVEYFVELHGPLNFVFGLLFFQHQAKSGCKDDSLDVVLLVNFRNVKKGACRYSANDQEAWKLTFVFFLGLLRRGSFVKSSLKESRIFSVDLSGH